MTREKLFLVLTEMAIQAKAIAMSQSPIRTGRMVKSIKILFHNDGFSVIVPEEIYYFKYTDELGDNPNPSPKQMRNAGWFSERTFNLMSNMIASKLGGSLTKIE